MIQLPEQFVQNIANDYRGMAKTMDTATRLIEPYNKKNEWSDVIEDSKKQSDAFNTFADLLEAILESQGGHPNEERTRRISERRTAATEATGRSGESSSSSS